MSTEIDFKEAIRLEAEYLDIEQLMEDVLKQMEDEQETDVKLRLDDEKIRRYMLAAKMIEENEEKLKAGKKAVVAQWDKLIAIEAAHRERLRYLVGHEIRLRKEEDSKFKNLKLDIGTLSVSKDKKEVKLSSAETLELAARMKGDHEKYIKPVFDSGSLMKDIKKQYTETGVIPPEYALSVEEVDKKGVLSFTSRIK